jgi:hypothetical protein
MNVKRVFILLIVTMIKRSGNSSPILLFAMCFSAVLLLLVPAYGADLATQGIMGAQEETNSEQEGDDVLVIYSKESNHQFLDVIIGSEAIEYLEKNLRDVMLNSHAQLLKNEGFSSDATLEVTNSRFTSVDALGVPVGLATIWLKNQTSEGEARSKYIYVAGVIGDTLHNVICSQLNGDDIILMANPKCYDKLVEVFPIRN